MWGTWDMLVDTLVRSSLIKIGDVFAHDAPQMALAQNEHVVQAFAAQTAQKPFAIGVRTRCSYTQKTSSKRKTRTKREGKVPILVLEDGYGFRWGCLDLRLDGRSWGGL